MVRAHRLIPLALAAYAVPAYAQERAADINIPAASAGEAARLLARQAGVSIGFRLPSMAKLRIRAVRGRYMPAQALQRMLAGTGASPRQVAPFSYMIEPAPPPPPARPPRAAPPPAAAPRAAPPPDDFDQQPDIIVTATKRQVPLGYYAGGVQVISGGSITSADGVHGTDLIESRAASVSSTHLGPGRNKLFIRGIADSSIVGPTQATVGQYWGNSRITYNAPDPSLRLYDVSSIEVLEGPQGTLYGAGSLGGVVRVVPNAPDLHAVGGRIWGGVEAIEHGSPGGDGGAILNVPLVDGKLGLRVLGFGGLDGGYIDDRERHLDDVNTVHTSGGRAALRYLPGNDWTLDLSVLGQRIIGDDSQYADRDGDGLSRSSAIAQPYRNEFWLTDLVASKRWDDLEFTASLSYAEQHVFEQFQGPSLTMPLRLDVAPAADAVATAFSQDNRTRMVTGEARLAKRGADGTGWLVAVSALHNVARIHRQTGGTAVAVGELVGGQLIQPVERSFLTGLRNQVDEVTLYGEYSARLIDRLVFTAGGRLTRTRLSGASEDVAPGDALRVDPAADAARTETRLLPSAALAYHPNEHATYFLRYQEGFRPGGIAVRQDFIQRFNGDNVKTAEAGARFGNSHLNTSLTLSWTRWLNIQADLIDGFGFPTTANIGDGRVLSVGWMGEWRPIRQLQLEAAVYFNESHIDNPTTIALSILNSQAQPAAVPGGVPVTTAPAATASIINQSRLPNVADHSGRIGFAYTAPVSGRDQIDLRGYARYVGKSVLGIGPILGRLQGDYVDTGLDLRLGNARRSFVLSVTNLLDSKGNRFALGSPFLVRNHDQITPLQPRSFRLGFDFSF